MITAKFGNLDNRYIKGVYSGTLAVPTFTDHGDGTATIGSVQASIYSTTDYTGVLNTYTIPQATLSFSDGGSQYIAIDYNSGSPVYAVKNSVQINGSNIVPVFKVWRVGSVLHSLDSDAMGLGLANKTAYSILSTEPYKRAGQSGLILSETAIPVHRTLKVSSAYVYAGTVGIMVAEFNSSIDQLTRVNHVSGVWTFTDVTQYDNSYYDDGTDLVALGNNKFAVLWVYRSIGDTKQVFYTLSNVEYNTLDASEEAQPIGGLPKVLDEHCMLVGKIIVENGASSGHIDSAFDLTFHGTGITDHNNLSNLQGGTTNEYYHLTSAEKTVVENTSGTNTGDQVGDGVTITGTGTLADPFVATASGGGSDTEQPKITVGNGTSVITDDGTDKFFFKASWDGSFTRFDITNGKTGNITCQFSIKKNGVDIGQDIDLTAQNTNAITGLDISFVTGDIFTWKNDSNTDARKVIVQGTAEKA